MARRGNPISVRLDLNRSSDSSWFSDYYYGKSIYQDLHMRSYFEQIQPPTRKTFGLRVGRSIILHFPKRTSISFFSATLPRRLQRRIESKKKAERKERKKTGRIRLFKVEKVEKVPKGKRRRKGKELGQSSKLDGGQKERKRIWPKKKEGFRSHERATAAKFLRWAFQKPTFPDLCHDTVFEIPRRMDEEKKEDALKKRKEAIQEKKKLLSFFRIRVPSYKDYIIKQPRTTPLRSSLHYALLQYFLKQKNHMQFDPVLLLKHFVAESASSGPEEKKERSSLDRRIWSRIAFYFVESLEKRKEEERIQKLTHFIRKVRNRGTKGGDHTTTNIALFPFFGATFFFQKEGLKVKKRKVNKDAKIDAKMEKIYWRCRHSIELRKLQKNKKVKKLINKMGQIEPKKKIQRRILIMRRRIMKEITWKGLLKGQRIPYKFNYYYHQVRKMKECLSKTTNTNIQIQHRLIPSIYQSASLIAQEIAIQLRKKNRSFRIIFNQILQNIPKRMKKGITGIRIACSGRFDGAEIARTEAGKYGKTSCNIFQQKMDYAATEVKTRYGILGVKVWIAYGQKRKNTCYIQKKPNFRNIGKADK